MTYTEVINKELYKLLPRKAKYTKKDINRVLIASLFNNKLNNGCTFTIKESRFIVLCTATYHGAECSQAVYYTPGLAL